MSVNGALREVAGCMGNCGAYCGKLLRRVV